MTSALYRFLVAVTYWHLRLGEEDRWRKAWEQGRFTDEDVEEVDQACAGRMDLFDAHRPFLQDVRLGEPWPRDEKGSPARLLAEVPTGTAINHFDHRHDDDCRICAVCCAKALIAKSMWASAEGRGLKYSVNAALPVYVFPEGEDLHRTLLLNCPGDVSGHEYHGDDRGPLWVQEPPFFSEDDDQGREVEGLAEALTWPARRVSLLPAEGGACTVCGGRGVPLVHRIHYRQGWTRTGQRGDEDSGALPPWGDPWVPLQKARQTGIEVPMQLTPGKPLWRDFPVMFLVSGDDHRPPPVITQLRQRQQFSIVPQETPVRFRAFGLEVKRATIGQWRQDSFGFPLRLLSQEESAAAVEQGLWDARQVAGDLAKAVRRLAPDRESAQRPKNPLAGALLHQARISYWEVLEPEFRRLLNDPGLLAEPQGRWTALWRQQIIKAARSAFEQVADGFDYDAEALRRYTLARAPLDRRLGRMRTFVQEYLGNSGGAA